LLEAASGLLKVAALPSLTEAWPDIDYFEDPFSSEAQKWYANPTEDESTPAQQAARQADTDWWNERQQPTTSNSSTPTAGPFEPTEQAERAAQTKQELSQASGPQNWYSQSGPGLQNLDLSPTLPSPASSYGAKGLSHQPMFNPGGPDLSVPGGTLQQPAETAQAPQEDPMGFIKDLPPERRRLYENAMKTWTGAQARQDAENAARLQDWYAGGGAQPDVFGNATRGGPQFVNRVRDVPGYLQRMREETAGGSKIERWQRAAEANRERNPETAKHFDDMIAKAKGQETAPTSAIAQNAKEQGWGKHWTPPAPPPTMPAQTALSSSFNMLGPLSQKPSVAGGVSPYTGKPIPGQRGVPSMYDPNQAPAPGSSDALAAEKMQEFNRGKAQYQGQLAANIERRKTRAAQEAAAANKKLQNTVATMRAQRGMPVPPGWPAPQSGQPMFGGQPMQSSAPQMKQNLAQTGMLAGGPQYGTMASNTFSTGKSIF